MADMKKKSDVKLFGFMLKYAKGYKFTIIAAFTLLGLTTLFMLLRPVVIGKVIDVFINGESNNVIKGLTFFGIIYFVLLILMSITSFFQTILIGNAGQDILYAIRKDLFEHIIKLDMKFFDQTPVGKIVTRITNDTETLNEMYTSVLLNVLKDIFIITGITIGAFIVHPGLALITLALLPVVLVTAAVFRKAAQKNYRNMRTHISALNAFLSETLSGIRTIQLFSIKNKKQREFETVNENVKKAYLTEVILYGIFRPLMYLSTQLVFIAILYLASKLIIEGKTTIGTLFIFIQYLNILFSQISELSEQFTIFQSAIAATEKIEETLSVKPTIISPQKPLICADDIKGHIEFKNVWFAYNNEEWVLKDINFIIEPGKSAAFVGPTGAGKSSIINVIARYYDIQKGEILIDGINIKEFEIDSLRKIIGVVMQDVFIFAGTFAENIRLFDDSINMDQIKKASQMVHADIFIDRYKEKYDHYLEERGSTLSAGQRQLVSFARVIAYNNPILVLDEATANIDTETENIVQDAVNILMKKRTSIAIAHRLSTVQHVSKIIVLCKGEIKETGTHAELLAIKGRYYQLYQHQFL